MILSLFKVSSCGGLKRVVFCHYALLKFAKAKKISVKQKKKEASSRSVSSGRHCEEITSVVLCVFKHILKAEVQTNTPSFLLLFVQFLFLKLYKNRNINFRVFVFMQASDFCRFVSIFLRCKTELPLKVSSISQFRYRVQPRICRWSLSAPPRSL